MRKKNNETKQKKPDQVQMNQSNEPTVLRALWYWISQSSSAEIKSCRTHGLAVAVCQYVLNTGKVIKNATMHLHINILGTSVSTMEQKRFRKHSNKTLSAAYKCVCLLLDQWGPVLWQYNSGVPNSSGLVNPPVVFIPGSQSKTLFRWL